MQGNVILGWNGEFGLHKIAAKLGAHISDFNGTGSAFYNWKYRYANFTAKADWSYDNRYDAGLGLSVFGSDAFAPGKQFVPYPTVSFGWNASNEEFLKGSPVVNRLRVRASAGFTGANEAYVGIEGFETGGRYLLHLDRQLRPGHGSQLRRRIQRHPPAVPEPPGCNR